MAIPIPDWIKDIPVTKEDLRRDRERRGSIGPNYRESEAMGYYEDLDEAFPLDADEIGPPPSLRNT